MKNYRKLIVLLLLIFFVIFTGAYAYMHIVEKRSLTSNTIEKTLPVVNQIKPQTIKEYQNYLTKVAKRNVLPVDIPQALNNEKVEITATDGMQTFTWNDKNNPKQKVIFYVHGGSYIHQASELQYIFVNKLAKKLDAKVVFPIYPKAPTYNYSDAIPKIKKLYQNTLASVTSHKQIILVGESAGGGLALGLADNLVTEHIKQPKEIILISPWLDIATNNPKIEKVQKKDPLLKAWQLQQVAPYWANGKKNFKNPQVSPLYSSQFNKMAPISFFIGTHDIFYPDNQLLHQKLAKENIKHHYIVGQKMNHVYPVLPIPEAETAFKQMLKIINH
ncbi:TPA: alpha/beta hydrolase fold domain-containing protein [Streptococcus agalactiae]|nr:alpha/beta hydrolase [Streptococcus agalactiae]